MSFDPRDLLVRAPAAAGGPFLRLIRSVAWTIARPVQRRLYIRGDVEFHDDLHLGVGSRIESSNGLAIGKHVYIGRYCSIVADGSIGDFVLIANNVGVVGRYDHDWTVVGVGISMAPWIGADEYSGPGRSAVVTIEDDVWLGFNSTVLTGTRVGRGSIVAAGAVVTSDVPPYSIVGGNPARVLGQRMPQDQIEGHEALLRLQ